MELTELDALPEGIEFDYRILGGFNSNAVECSWRISDDRFRIQWIALKTFTGSQLKYVLPKKRSPLLFALADEDAYVYCDKDVCLECTFMCKRGVRLLRRRRGHARRNPPHVRSKWRAPHVPHRPPPPYENVPVLGIAPLGGT